ncbi:MAG TPA: hypothetical protein VMX38_22220 [Verrucomicrobiae bacterium]|nr:hypothetical protein [Verrucomicrobiae bacterium]
MRNRTLFPLLCLAISAALFAPQLSFAQFTINTVAGGGPNNLPAQQASIGSAQSVALDSAGNVYIADAFSSQIFKVSTSGTLTIVAGNGTMGYSGDGGPATTAALNQPESVFVDASGNIFIADTYNSVIREVTASNGYIQTVAGNFAAGSGYSGDGGPATSAQLNNPFGVFVDTSGNIFIADSDNNVIREVTTSNDNIQTIAGGGSGCTGQTDALGDGCPATSAILTEPEGVFVDASGNIFIADTLDSVIREVTISNGVIQTVAGTYYNSASGSACQFTGDSGPATSAFLCLPASIFVNSSGDLYIADTANYAIREVVSGTITTVAGTLGSYGYSGNGGAANQALLLYPGGVTVDASGDIFIADTDNYVVREVTAGNIQAFAGNNTVAYSGDGGPAPSAALNALQGVFIDGSGNIFIADSANNVVREVVASTGDIQTVAGDGTPCATPIPGGCGDGAAATSAQLNYPTGVFVDASGNIYIADTGLVAGVDDDSVIRVVNPGASAVTIAGTSIGAGDIQTIVGTLGTAGYGGDGLSPTSPTTQLYDPQTVILDASGNIFIADTGNSAIRVVNTGTANLVIGNVSVAPGTINTVAGTPGTSCGDATTGCGDNGAANAATLSVPTGVAVDSAEDVYIADSQNSAIRVVNASTQDSLTIAGSTIPPGDILTVAGTLGRDGYTGDGGAPTAATLNIPYSVSIDSLGNIYIADSQNSAIREVVAVSGLIQTIAGNGVGTAGFSGDGGPATSAELNNPSDVKLGASGIFIADTDNSRVRQLTSTVGVSVVPSSTTLAPGATQQFLANVSGATNANVTWQVNSVTGGNSTVGTISTLGLYQAPATAPSSAITITAISDADGVTSGSAQVSIAASGAPAISVSTTPAGVTVVYTSATQPFTATVTGETNTDVNWEVNTTVGGNSTIGTIDTNGNYTAPSSVPSPALVMITAVSQADSSLSGTYPITIVSVPSAQQPASQTISPGGSATFSIALNANTGNPHDPIKLSCLQSSLPSGASCSFTPATITPSSSAVSFSLIVTVPTSTATFEKPHTIWMATYFYFPFIPLAGIVFLSGKRRSLRGRSLWLGTMCLLLFALMACGGGNNSSGNTTPQTYNIQVQGTTAAQPTPVTITTVTLTVQ